MPENIILLSILFAITGIATGTLSGLLGIGGSVVVIPALYLLLGMAGIPETHIMQYAIGSAFAIMFFTALVNAISHIRLKNVNFEAVKKLFLFVVIGVIIGVWSIQYFDSSFLSKIFAVFLLIISIDLFIKIGRPCNGNGNHSLIYAIMGLIIGSVSGFLGIGGGSLTIPFLMYMGFDSRKVFGTSAVITFPVAVTGSAVSILHMFHIENSLPLSAGYVYLPAFIIVGVFSMISVPFGAKLLLIISQKTARRIYAVILLITSVRMFFS